MTAGLRRDNFLSHALRRGVKSAASGRKDRERIVFVVEIYSGRKLLGIVRFLQYLFMSACRVDLVFVVLFLYRNISISYLSNHRTTQVYSINCCLNWM